MKLAYKAFDKAGKQVVDVLEAAGIAEAGEQLRRQGLFVVEIAERGAADLAGGMGGRPRGSGRAKGRTGRLRDMSSFMRQLSVLVATGTPMVEAIAALERQLPGGAWQGVVSDVRKRIEEGAQFSDALAHHPMYFDAVSRSLIAAGESGGQLDAMLRRLSALTRQQLKVRSAVLGAMIYPCVLVFVSIIVLVAMIGFVLPRFEGLFETLGASLPASTRMLMDLGDFFKNYWWGILGGLIAAVAGTRYFLRTPSGRVAFDRVVVRLPQFGRIVRSLATARICRVLGVLLEGKVPLLDALRLTREATGNSCYVALVDRAESFVTRGENISGALSGSRLVNASITEAIRSGEKTGQLGTVLLSVAEFLDEDNEVIVRSLASIVEPLILMVLGVMVGFVALSMFLPLFDLTSTAGAGGH